MNSIVTLRSAEPPSITRSSSSELGTAISILSYNALMNLKYLKLN